MKIQLSTSSRAIHGGAYFSAVFGRKFNPTTLFWDPGFETLACHWRVGIAPDVDNCMISLFVSLFMIWLVLVFGMNCYTCVWLDIVYSRTDPMASNTNMNTNLRKLQRQRSPNGGSITCRILHHDDDRGRRPRVKRGGCISCLTLQNVYVFVSNCKFYLS